mmetsp:Transcript_59693/g.167282  ORF Transcript_59693/g.167282 Transcript_59693/m.167282 type:complete len:361 (+) Transcript_59693:70-1152(+)
MSISPEVSLVVKRTFLEWIRTDAPRRSRPRSLTDSDLLGNDATKGVLDGCLSELDVDGSDTTVASCTSSESSPMATDTPPDLRSHPEAFPTTPVLGCVMEQMLVEADLSATAEVKDALGWPPSAMGALAEPYYFPHELYVDQSVPFPWGWAYLPCDDGSFSDCGMWVHGGAWPAELGPQVDCKDIGDCQGSDSASTADASASTGSDGGGAVEEARSTVMLREMPIGVDRDMLVQVLDQLGLYGLYDMVYVPVDFSSGSGLGYAFVNMVSPQDVAMIWKALDGFSDWGVDGSHDVCSVRWAEPHQGLVAHVERYRNSPVMHPDVPDDWKPALFAHGTRIAFPPPLKKLKAPKVRSKKAPAS